MRTINPYNQNFRRLKKVPDNYNGVFVTKVLRGGSAENYLQKDDLILEIDGLPIGKNGTVLFDKETRVDFVEIVDNKHSGEMIYLKIFRDGKIQSLQFPAKKMMEFDLIWF